MAILDLLSYEVHDLGGYKGWRLDAKQGFSYDRLQRDSAPGCVRTLVQNHSIRQVEKFLGGFLEVRGCRIEHGQIKIGTNEFQNAVRFQNHVAGFGDAATDRL